MSDGVLRIRATVRMLLETDGGRTVRRSDYRPNHDLGLPNGMAIGRIALPEGGELTPEASVEVVVTFLDAPGVREALYPGRTWIIREGARAVAEATVTACLP